MPGHLGLLTTRDDARWTFASLLPMGGDLALGFGVPKIILIAFAEIFRANISERPTF